MKKIKDVSIEGEGKQLRKFLEDKYSYSELAEKFQLYDTTIQQYLKNKVITNSKFISQIEEIFQLKFYEMIIPVERQTNHYIISIRDNIKKYNQKEDERILYQVYHLSLKHTDLYHQLIAKGNFAKFKFNLGFEYEATQLISEIVVTSGKNNFNDLTIYYSVHLSSMYLSHDLKQSIKILDGVNSLLNQETSNKHLYMYNYLYGIILNRLGRSKEARAFFEISFRYTDNENEKAICLSNIGLTYYNEKKYKLALMWNQRALDKTQVNQEIRSSVLNNIANIYIKKGEVERAAWYLEKAMENFREEFDIHRKISIYDTYLEISSKEGTRLVDDLMNILTGSFGIIGHQQYLVGSVNKLFIHLIQNGELVNIKNLLFQLINFCQKIDNHRGVKDLKAIIVDIIIYLNGKGGIKYEEVCQSIAFYNDF